MTGPTRVPTASGRSARLEILGLTKHFGATIALDDVDFTAHAGEVHGLLGANGAGKSTLIEIIAGNVRADDGTISIDGQPAEIRSPGEARALGIAVIHQALSIIPSLTVAENFLLKYAGERLGSPLRPDRRRAADLAKGALARLGVRLAPDIVCERLTFSERQLVEIAIAISSDVKVLVMDEPTSALSESEQQRLYAVVRSLAAGGTAIVYVSHRMDEVFRLASRITVLRGGRKVVEFDRDEIDRTRVIESILGRAFDEATQREDTPSQAHRPQPLVLEATEIEADRVRGVTIRAHAGEIVGLYGVVGAGCSELLESVFGARRCRGTVTVGGRPLRRRSPTRSRRGGTALVPPDHRTRGVVAGESIAENLLLGRGRWRSGWLRRITRATRSELTDAAAAFNLIYRHLDEDVSVLSGGNQQKVVFARWFLDRPTLLLLDDPTQGIDVGAKADIYQRLRELRRAGVGIVLHTSELTELVDLADRVEVMRDGRIVGSLTGDEIDRHRVLELAADA